MKSCVLLLIPLVPTAESAALVRIDQWHWEYFSAAGCKAATKLKDKYEPLAVCLPEDATTWSKVVGTATTYTRTGYSDKACTIECTSACTEEKLRPNAIGNTQNAACHKDPLPTKTRWMTGSVVTTADILRLSGPYTDSACLTLDTGAKNTRYHGPANICFQGLDLDDIAKNALGSTKWVCTGTTITKSTYKTTTDCSGTVEKGTALTSGDVCHADPENTGKFRKSICGPMSKAFMDAARSTSSVMQLLFGAALAAVMSF